MFKNRFRIPLLNTETTSHRLCFPGVHDAPLDGAHLSAEGRAQSPEGLSEEGGQGGELIGRIGRTSFLC